MNIYIIGVLCTITAVLINYSLFLKKYNINYPYSWYYYNELFWQVCILGMLSWFGFLFTLISILNYLKENKND